MRLFRRTKSRINQELLSTDRVSVCKVGVRKCLFLKTMGTIAPPQPPMVAGHSLVLFRDAGTVFPWADL